jgi:hypothetical protein
MAEGLKKAGSLGGLIFLLRDKAGTSNLVLPSIVSVISVWATIIKAFYFC